MLRLREAIAKMYSPLIGQDLDPEENIVVTAGATEAVFDSFAGHTSDGDEWIVIEPAYTMYLPMIKMTKGVPRFTSLKLVCVILNKSKFTEQIFDISFIIKSRRLKRMEQSMEMIGS